MGNILEPLGCGFDSEDPIYKSESPNLNENKANTKILHKMKSKSNLNEDSNKKQGEFKIVKLQEDTETKSKAIAFKTLIDDYNIQELINKSRDKFQKMIIDANLKEPTFAQNDKKFKLFYILSNVNNLNNYDNITNALNVTLVQQYERKGNILEYYFYEMYRNLFEKNSSKIYEKFEVVDNYKEGSTYYFLVQGKVGFSSRLIKNQKDNQDNENSEDCNDCKDICFVTAFKKISRNVYMEVKKSVWYSEVTSSTSSNQVFIEEGVRYFEYRTNNDKPDFGLFDVKCYEIQNLEFSSSKEILYYKTFIDTALWNVYKKELECIQNEYLEVYKNNNEIKRLKDFIKDFCKKSNDFNQSEILE